MPGLREALPRVITFRTDLFEERIGLDRALVALGGETVAEGEVKNFRRPVPTLATKLAIRWARRTLRSARARRMWLSTEAKSGYLFLKSIAISFWKMGQRMPPIGLEPRSLD